MSKVYYLTPEDFKTVSWKILEYGLIGVDNAVIDEDIMKKAFSRLRQKPDGTNNILIITNRKE